MEKAFRKTGKVMNVPLYDSLNGVLYNVPEKLGQLQKILKNCLIQVVFNFKNSYNIFKIAILGRFNEDDDSGESENKAGESMKVVSKGPLRSLEET